MSGTHGRVRLLGGLFVVFALLAAVSRSGPGAAQETNATPEATPALPAIPPETTDYAGDWPVPQGNLASTRAALNSTIDSSTVANLSVAWTFDITAAGFFGAVTANPIVVGDTVYIQDMQSNIFALDRASGSVKWQADFNVGSIGPNGVAVGYGMVYAGLSDTGEVVALDAASGAEVWRQKIGSPPGEGIDMAPIVYNGSVYISTVPGTGLGSFYAGGDRGVLYVLDARTGEVEWWWDTTDGGWDAVAVAGGGGLWYPPSIDEQGNIYFGTGNPAPWPLTPECPNASCRPGDNLYTSSMVSLDPTTGAVRWYYQDRKHDLLDHDFQLTPILATVNIGGTDTNIAIGAGKTGNVVAVNADDGTVIWKTPVGMHQNDDVTELPTDSYLEVYPGTYGGVESPIAYADGTVFVTYLDLPQYQGATGADPVNMADFTQATGGIVAINAADGTVKWEIKLPTLVVGGATVANDLVFTSGLDGFVRAYDVATGAEVWSYEAPLGINAPPAIAGDMLFVPAGFVKLPQVGSTAAATPADAAATPPTAQLIAFRIGGAGEGATPIANAAPTQAPLATEVPAAETPTEAAATGGTMVEVDMVDIAFTQKELTIPANTDVTLHVVNQGAAVHNFKIDDPAVFSGDVQPGASADVVVNLPPGTYQYYCAIPGHREAGMVGSLTVQ